MKLISWNVNGIRAVLKKGFLDFIAKYDPDVLCLQEIKIGAEAIDLQLPQYHPHWHSPSERLGYSGTAVFSKTKPASVAYGMGREKHDAEGRIITAEFQNFRLVNVYVPNSKRDLSRLDYRTKEWDIDFLAYLKKLETQKPVVLCGDMNVAHKEIDLTYPQANVRNHGFTPEERAGFERVLRAGFLDTFREFCPDGGYYTWWSPMNNCRKRNIGWRIDYFCISKILRPRLRNAAILSGVMGSDHCPVLIELEDAASPLNARG